MPNLLCELDGQIAALTLNNPERRNALSDELLVEWAARLDELAGDHAVHAVVVTGAGEGFCSGGDISAMLDAAPSAEAFKRGMETVHLVARSVARFEKPLVGAVNGPAYGAGMDMALMCDLRVASERASFCASYIRLGLVAGNGGAYYLPRLVGQSAALDLLLTGREVRAQEALRMGLVNSVVPHEQTRGEAVALAKLVPKYPLASRAMKRLVRHSADIDLDAALELASSQVAILRCGAEHQEALSKHRRRPRTRRVEEREFDSNRACT